jgi:flagellar hook-basal body complex protein FliE
MAINPASVAAAYSTAAKMATGAPTQLEAAAPSPDAGGKFAAMLKDVVDAMAKTGGQAETQAVAGATQDAELVDVVTSIAAAELTLETVVAVRDKVIAAYQDIMKMPI